MVPTGVAVAIPPGTAGLVLPRSGLAIKHGISCVNAPPSATGELILSRQAQESGPCIDGVRVFVSLDENDVVAVFPAVSSAAGYAEVEVPALGPGTPEIHAQYRWVDPGDCRGRPCSGSAPLSTSDALRIRVR